MLRSMLTNHPLVNILFVVVVVMGLMSYMTMPREQDPEINFNWVNINTVLPGASAEDVEKLITSPLEDAIRNVQDVRFVNSASRESVSNILVRFRDISERTFDKRINDLRREIQNKANEELPEEADDPVILEITTSNGFPTALVVVMGQADDEQLREQTRVIKEDLERLTGVDQVVAAGLHDPEMQVEFDPQALANRNLQATDIADALGRAFRDVSAGTAQIAGAEWLVRVEGTTSDPEELAQFQLSPSNNPQQRIALDTVAEVRRGREEATQLVAFEGRPAVSLSVTKISYTNTLQLVDRINEYIQVKNQQLNGTGVSLILADDQTIQTRDALSIMQRNAILGLSLVLLVCWLFLGFRIAAMVTLGIVFSITGTFWFLNITGNTVNVSVLLGIVIVLGMLVDDAVVVVEAVYYRMQRGAKGVNAAMGALKEVGLPVTSAVMTTMAAFLPLMLLPGIVGKFMFVIPFVVTVGLAVSLIEAFWILPAHVISMPKVARDLQQDKSNWRKEKTRWIRLKYAKMLCHVIRRPKRYLTLGFLTFAIAVASVSAGLVRNEFFTFDPIRLFYVNVDMPADAPLEETLKQTIAVEQRVRKFVQDHEIRAITSLAGIKFTEVEPLYGDQYGQIQVSLNPRGSDGREVSDVVESMREFVTAAPGDAIISFLQISGGPPAGKPISVKVRSDDFTELRAAADAVKEMVENLEGTKDVTDNDVAGRSELALELDMNAIRRVGLDPGSVSRLLRLHLDGEVVAFMRDKGEKVELRVRAKKRNHQDIQAVLNDPVAIPGGGVTTFAALFKQNTDKGRSTIRHYNLRRAITVEAEIDPLLTNTAQANAELVAAWEEMRIQFPNTDLDFSGELDDIEESLNAMLGLFVLGLGLIYLILATQFRSYFQPILILVTVPMAFTGVVFGLIMTGNPMSLYTLYGVIALTGIAVNSAIVLIDAANTRIKAGMRPLHATVYAARRRVVPVLMTTTTTIAGLFSLAVGLGGKSLLWGPVASSIVAGLAVASVLTLFMVPTLYRQFMKGHGVKTGDDDDYHFDPNLLPGNQQKIEDQGQKIRLPGSVTSEGVIEQKE
ncbi:efflux RND transporter permease subunit [Marinicella sp. W31]|uniref:efflux RND transporter permease subunit n=1 Tax=Marinicella sp. W31 TaxID=3023713 RepID=UPI0037575E3E